MRTRGGNWGMRGVTETEYDTLVSRGMPPTLIFASRCFADATLSQIDVHSLSAARERLLALPHIALGALPTPIDAAPRLRAAIGMGGAAQTK